MTLFLLNEINRLLFLFYIQIHNLLIIKLSHEINLTLFVQLLHFNYELFELPTNMNLLI